jgi:hypothetical protein
MVAHARALDRLRAADRALATDVGVLESLRPGAKAATPLVEIGERGLGADVSSRVADVFSQALSEIALAQAESFPGNLFWDFDYPAARLLDATRSTEGEGLGAAVALVVDLVHAFGRNSPVNFRYVHDLSYGFDWARWVARDSAGRGGVGPFDPAFLSHMRRRGAEITALIARGDAKYPALRRGVARNPFGFSREPEDEARLMKDLAERGLVPVEAWDEGAVPRWDRDYGPLREARAHALGIWKKP